MSPRPSRPLVPAVLAAVAALALSACASGGGAITALGDAKGSAVTTRPVGDPATCAGDATRPDTHRYATMDGVEADLHSLDVYTGTAAKGCPVVVWVHGGAWSFGDKAGRGVDEKVAFLGDLGVSMVSVNYRLSGVDNDVRWPDAGHDVAAAVAWVVEHGPELGLDSERVALMGHSAGAQLVSIVATNPSLLAAHGLDRERVGCVVSMDTAANDLRDPAPGLARVVDAVFGQDPDVLAEASPLVQAAEHPRGIPPFMLVTRGRPARVDGAESFADALRSAGTSAQVLNANPYSHMEVNTQLGAAGEAAVTAPVTRFLAECLAA